ncbi:hypothetical protein F2Q70_00020766 [Brassica cretica]|uniref:DEAD/DEAH-box helicase domain-containing protein n=1 Tax=Brassica cretica TaxID=69181 RepID=A0A8S9GU60_BRACR|nr:hypothetical protein F2Q70_00020766 [Brassica cretica]
MPATVVVQGSFSISKKETWSMGDIAYLVLDEADTMFDRGFRPDIRKFLAPLKQRALKTNDHGFQTVLVTDTRISIWASS